MLFNQKKQRWPPLVKLNLKLFMEILKQSGVASGKELP